MPSTPFPNARAPIAQLVRASDWHSVNPNSSSLSSVLIVIDPQIEFSCAVWIFATLLKPFVQRSNDSLF